MVRDSTFLPAGSIGHERTVEISVVAPTYNEEGNLTPLYCRLVSALEPLRRSFEIIYVDDGSDDGSFLELSQIASHDTRVHVVQLARHLGQTAAMAAGIDYSSGDKLVFIDADLQNDPDDIPRLLAVMDDGYDLVSGWRKDRKDAKITRVLPSKIANALISRVTGVKLQDYGCTLKAYKTDLLRHMSFYGEMHRFLPAYAALEGARIAELPVNHYPRVRGRSKYGLMRTFKVPLDLLTIKFLGSFATKPIYLFGGLGLLFIPLGFLMGAGMIWHDLVFGSSLIQTALLLLSTMLILVGFQSILIGLLCELLMRTYHESQGKRAYVVRDLLNGAKQAPPSISFIRQSRRHHVPRAG